MNKIYAVLRREFIARVRTRAFIVSTLILPIVIVAASILPALLSRGTRTMRVAIVDAAGDSLGASVQAALAVQQLPHDSGAVSLPRYRLERVAATPATALRIQDSLIARTGLSRERDSTSLDGVLVLSDSTLRTGKLEYLGDNASALEAMGQLESSVTRVLMVTRLKRSGVDPATVLGAMTPADVTTIKVSDGRATGESGAASFIVAYIMGFLLYLMIIIYGQQTLTSVIEEKTSRIMEVLASSLRPFQMLLGKILGVGLTGLLQMGIWAATVVLVTSQREVLARIFGVSASAMQQLPIPSIPADLLILFLLYFILGFLLYGAVYAAVGSMFNTVQEAQQVAMFVQFVIMIGFFTLFAVIKDPTGGIGVTMSFVPFFSPFIMPARWSLSGVPTYQLIGSLAISVFSLFAVAWLAGRIYRTGMLMYGKKPTLLEALRWIGTK